MVGFHLAALVESLFPGRRDDFKESPRQARYLRVVRRPAPTRSVIYKAIHDNQ